MIWMHRYWNSPRQNAKFFAPHRWRPNLSVCCPGHIGDPKNAQPGGFRRFERWYDRPILAQKLYWRQSPK